jgi:hypothetical protein
MMLSLGNLLFGGTAILILFMFRQIWLSERTRRSIERAREAHLAKERDLARIHQRERGD